MENLSSNRDLSYYVIICISSEIEKLPDDHHAMSILFEMQSLSGMFALYTISHVYHFCWIILRIKIRKQLLLFYMKNMVILTC